MFGRRIPLFKIFGFPVSLDPSWFIILLLITWTLALGYFPVKYSHLTTAQYWMMGLIGALGLFCSVIIHEYFHALVAQHYGLPIRGITLFIFGGVSEIAEEPHSPKSEFLIAIVGPLSSFALAFLLSLSASLGRVYHWPIPLVAILGYLGMINVLLAIFNLLPAFPLDGGRVLRSIIWHFKKNLLSATRIASEIGNWFGIVLIIIGILSVFAGGVIAGIWWVLIGIFLKSSAKMAYQQLLMRKMLSGEPVSKFMLPNPVAIPSSTSIKSLVNDYFFHYHLDLYPVVDNDKLVGCINVDQIKTIPQEEWPSHTVAELVPTCTAAKTVSPDTSAADALNLMEQSGTLRLLVTLNDRLVGILSLSDLLALLSKKKRIERAST